MKCASRKIPDEGSSVIYFIQLIYIGPQLPDTRTR
jgi:hypothetical protein